MQRLFPWAILGALCFVLPVEAKSAKKRKEPARVTVQHLLVAFKGSLEGRDVQRTPLEAEALAKDLFKKAKQEPGKFEDLVRAHSDDQVPGIYLLVNFGIPPKGGEFARASMVKDFGDAAFGIEELEFAFVSFEKKKSPYGWHIIRRLKPQAKTSSSPAR